MQVHCSVKEKFFSLFFLNLLKDSSYLKKDLVVMNEK